MRPPKHPVCMHSPGGQQMRWMLGTLFGAAYSKNGCEPPTYLDLIA